MRLDLWNVEGNAARVYELARADLATPPGTPHLAAALLGPGCIRRVSRAELESPAALARVGTKWRIYLRRGLTAAEINFLVGHELAEWFYRDQRDPHIERACDALAAALVAPRQAVASRYRMPSDVRALADELGCSDTCAALRVGEALRTAVAVVSPTRVRVRSSRALPEDVRELAKCLPPHITRLGLRATDRRFALVAS